MGCLLALVATGCTETEPGLSQFTVVTGGRHHLAADETVKGNVVVLRGGMDIPAGADLDGALLMVSGSSVVAGTIDGDIWLINGTLTLAPDAYVDGSVNVVGGELERAEGARIIGRVRAGQEVQLLGPASSVSPVERAFRGLAGTLFLATFAYTLVRVWPRPLLRVAQAASEEPSVAGAVGGLTLIVVPALLVLMGLTILLIPVCLIGVLLFVALLTYGWVGVALALGRLVAAKLHWRQSPAPTAALGMVIQMIFTVLSGLIPVVGGIVIAVELSVALGSALLTGVGTRAYTPATQHSSSLRSNEAVP
jgi:hypothetical protein